MPLLHRVFNPMA
jgi:hypothetical protein